MTWSDGGAGAPSVGDLGAVPSPRAGGADDPTVLPDWPGPSSFRIGPAPPSPAWCSGSSTAPTHSLTTFAAGSLLGLLAVARIVERLQQKLVR